MLFYAYQAEFSPPLDTSLIAAIVADYVNDSQPLPSQEELGALRKTLSELAAEADNQVGEDNLLASMTNMQLADLHKSDDSCHTESVAELFSAESSTTNTTMTSEMSSNGPQSLNAPLRFLRAAFPHLAISRLKGALGGAEDMDTIDMEGIVEDIISVECACELEERGGEETGGETTVEPRWELVPSRLASKKQKRKNSKTITLVDIRQKQHAPSSSAPSSARPAVPDPWTQLTSVACHIETLIPSRTSAYFQSFFHSPRYATPSEALRAALVSVAPPASGSTEMTHDETQILFGMFDILRESPAYEALPDVDREQMMSDAQLALRATEYHADAALDLVWLLREFDGGEVDLGIYHSPVPTSPSSVHSTPNSRQSRHPIKLPAGTPAASAYEGKARSVRKSGPNSPLAISTAAWQTVPISPRNSPNPHAEFIPAYNDARNGQGKHNNGSQKTSKSHKQRAGELMQKRREALREASRAWQRGTSSTRGGEVAFYFAERVSLCVHVPSPRRTGNECQVW